MKIAFFGTPRIAVPCLESLIKSSHEVVLVVTQPDRPAGRKKTITPPPVKELALKHSIPVLQPEKAKDESFLAEYKKYAPDLNIIMAYGQILPDTLIYHPKHDSINLHASLLPKYRGASPISAAIINGDTETGISFQFIEARLDAGDIMHVEKINIDPCDTAASLTDKISRLAGETAVKVTGMVESGSFKRVKQDELKSTYVKTLKKEDGRLNFSDSSENTRNKIRGMLPWPVAFSELDGKKIKIFGAEITNTDSAAAPGDIISIIKDKGFTVKTADSALLITSVQLEGGKQMTGYEFSLGHKDLKGKKLK